MISQDLFYPKDAALSETFFEGQITVESDESMVQIYGENRSLSAKFPCSKQGLMLAIECASRLSKYKSGCLNNPVCALSFGFTDKETGWKYNFSTYNREEFLLVLSFVNGVIIALKQLDKYGELPEKLDEQVVQEVENEFL